MERLSANSDVWRIELFGGLTAHRAGRTMERCPTQKVGVLLATLACYPQRRHTREELIDMLWPDADLQAARNRLSQALVWLRPQLEPDGVTRGSVLIADRGHIGLNAAAFTTDVAEFDALVTEGRRDVDPDIRKDALARAVALYKDQFLPGYYNDWILDERRRLLDAFALALRTLVGLHEESGQHDLALGYARQALAVEPLQEEAHCDVIRLLALTGRTAAALRQFQELRRVMQEELGAEPSEAAVSLVEGIKRRVSSQVSAPAVSAPSTPLPASLTPLFGWVEETERLRDALLADGARLVTLIGTGGTGKTRLALAAGARIQEERAGGVVFVPLADIDAASMIPRAIASVLRLPAEGGASMEQLAEVLSARPYLLILDNLEHLVDGAGALVRELLERVSSLTILATSRQRLGLGFEREVAVPPLHVPPVDAEPDELLKSASVQLFVDRARAVNPAFSVTKANASAVAQVCERLEGIPLAIELCAAWAQTLTPAQMLEKLGRRFDLLVSRRTDIPPRHRTLRAALEYSYLQLPPDLQIVYKSTSVFRGSWSLEAAEAIIDGASHVETSWRSHFPPRPENAAGAWPTLRALAELCERSLIVTEESGTAMRFRMLESLREFAGEQLSYAERSALRSAHAAYYLRLVEETDAATVGVDQDRRFSDIDREQENIRAALNWSLETEDAVFGLRLAGALGRYWSVRGALQEGARWLENLLTLPAPEIDPVIQAKAWSTLGHLVWSQGDFPAARTAHEQALELRRGAGDEADIAESLYHLGITAYREDDFAQAKVFLEESLAISRERENPAGIARVLLNLGNIAYEQEDYEEARDLVQQSLDIEKSLGNRIRTANALHNLGLIARDSGQYDLADRLILEALAINQALTDNYGAASTLANLGAVAIMKGQPDRARKLLVEGLKLAHEVGNRHIIVYYLVPTSILESEEGRWTNSVYLLSAARRLLDQIGSLLGSATVRQYDTIISGARAHLGEAAFDAAWLPGQSDSLGQIVAKALALNSVDEIL